MTGKKHSIDYTKDFETLGQYKEYYEDDEFDRINEETKNFILKTG
jgi:hypothetical protein